MLQHETLDLSSQVLMHILPSEIEQIINKVVNMSNEHIINIDWYEEKIPRNVAPHIIYSPI